MRRAGPGGGLGGVAGGDLVAVQTFPGPERHLPEVRLDHGLEAVRLGNDLGRRARPLERARVDGGGERAGEGLGNGLGLLLRR